MRLLVCLLALALGGASAFVVSCGGDRSHLIPSTDASSLNSALDDVASATKDGDCTKAGQALSRAQGVLVNLPASVDAKLRRRISSGLANLRDRVPQQCQKTTSTQAPATTEQPTQTETQPTQTETQTQTETTQTETTPPDTTSTPTTPPDTTSTQNTTGGTSG